MTSHPEQINALKAAPEAAEKVTLGWRFLQVGEWYATGDYCCDPRSDPVLVQYYDVPQKVYDRDKGKLVDGIGTSPAHRGEIRLCQILTAGHHPYLRKTKNDSVIAELTSALKPKLEEIIKPLIAARTEQKDRVDALDESVFSGQIEWSLRVFGPGLRTEGNTRHIEKELAEIRANPTDVEEWIDVAMLALDGAWRAGATPRQIIDGYCAKLEKNFKRSWPTPTATDPVEHVRTEQNETVRDEEVREIVRALEVGSAIGKTSADNENYVAYVTIKEVDAAVALISRLQAARIEAERERQATITLTSQQMADAANSIVDLKAHVASAHALIAECRKLLSEVRATFEGWKDVAPAVSLCADIDKLRLHLHPD